MLDRPLGAPLQGGNAVRVDRAHSGQVEDHRSILAVPTTGDEPSQVMTGDDVERAVNFDHDRSVEFPYRDTPMLHFRDDG